MKHFNLRLPKLRKISQVPKPPSQGLYHFEKQWGDSERSRIHLRIDPDGSGLLIVNASRVMHLNPSATFMAHMILQDIDNKLAYAALSRCYRVTYSQAKMDYGQCALQIQELIRPDGACPIHELNLEVTPPFSEQPTAPYRMDIALTYRCNNDCSHCYNARNRDFPELNTEQWKQIITLLWEYGIPHIVFTGGEPTLRDDLPELIAHAEQNGQITGLNTNGRRISDRRYLDQLTAAGLDHVQITLESHLPQIHDQMVGNKGSWSQTVSGIKNALQTRLFVMTNTTMLSLNSASIADTLTYLASLGVPTVGLNALIYAGKGAEVGTGLPESSLEPLLKTAREITSSHGQNLIWYTPTQYCNLDPVLLDLGVKGCTAALYNMCVEPNGDVIPCQSYYTSLGNILNQSWNEIWNHNLAIQLRQRYFSPPACKTCDLFIECGGGCPLLLNITDHVQLGNGERVYD